MFLMSNPFPFGLTLAGLVTRVGFRLWEPAKPIRKHRRHMALRFDALEERRLLSEVIITVTNLDSSSTESGTLPNAIILANQDAAGNANTVQIDFASKLKGTIFPTATMSVGNNVNIVGPNGAKDKIVISGTNMAAGQPVFAITGTDLIGAVNIDDLTIENAAGGALVVGNGAGGALNGDTFAYDKNAINVDTNANLIYEGGVISNNTGSYAINAVQTSLIDVSSVICSQNTVSTLFNLSSTNGKQLAIFHADSDIDETGTWLNASGTDNLEVSGCMFADVSGTQIKAVGDRVLLMKNDDFSSVNVGAAGAIVVQQTTANASAKLKNSTFTNLTGGPSEVVLRTLGTITASGNTFTGATGGALSVSGTGAFVGTGNTLTGNPDSSFPLVNDVGTHSFTFNSNTVSDNNNPGAQDEISLVNSQTVVMDDNQFVANAATIDVSSSPLGATDTAVFDGNTFTGNTGVVNLELNGGITTVSNTLFQGNTTSGAFSEQVLVGAGTNTFSNDTWNGNFFSAMEVASSGTTTLTGCTIENQLIYQPNPNFSGPAIKYYGSNSYAGAKLDIESTTITGISSSSFMNPDQAVIVANGTLTLGNDSITGNTGGIDEALQNGEALVMNNDTLSSTVNTAPALNITGANDGTSTVSIIGGSITGLTTAIDCQGGIALFYMYKTTIVGALDINTTGTVTIIS